MNKKMLFAACALPLVFTACNDELENVVVEEQMPSTEIVGAKLVGEGMTIEVNRGGVTSRLTHEGEFVDGDEMGLAWYKSTSAGEEGIFGNQIADNFSWENYTKNANDNKIYGNHKFIKNGNVWATQANVYEGFHFAYYPYAYAPKIAEITITPNAAEQTASYTEEFNDKAFWISAQDTVLATAVTEEGTVKKQIDMIKAVNTLKFNVAPAAPFSTDLKDLKILGVEIQTGGADAMFYPSATIQPAYLPYAVYEDADNDGETDEYNSAKTLEKMTSDKLFGKDMAIKLGEAVTSMKTIVSADANLTMEQAQDVRMFLLPTNSVSLAEGGLAIHVYVEGGVFRIYPFASAADDKVKNGAATEKNKKALANLRALLSENGLKAANSDKVYKLSELSYSQLPINIELVAADFNPDFSSISDMSEWNAAATIADAMELENPKFVVDGDIKITSENVADFKIPANGVQVETKENNKISVETDYTMPQILADGLAATTKTETTGSTTTTTTLKEAAKLYVKAGATLTIEDNATLEADTDNDGIINVGYKADVKNVDNEGARINVVYGSFVSVKDGKVGTIAYVVPSDYTAFRINNLINTEDGKVNVNTLVIDGITFELNKNDGETVFDDEYVGETNPGVVFDQEAMAEINFELNNGIITAPMGLDWAVKNVKVLGGNNEMWNTDVKGTLTVEDGKLVVDATEKNGMKNSLNIKNIVNKDELQTNTEIFAETVANPASSSLSTINIWYSNSYTQGGSLTGGVNKITTSVPSQDVTGNLTLDNSLNGTAKTVGSGSNKALINVAQNVTIDGKGYTIAAEDANGTYDAVIFTAGNTVKNVTLEGAFRGIYNGNTITNDMLIENVTFKDVVYTLNFGGGNGKKLTVKNSKLYGWTSYGTGFGEVKFTGCIFGEGGNGSQTYAFCRPYSSTTFENCTFSNGFMIGCGEADITYTFKNCKFENGSPVTEAIIDTTGEEKKCKVVIE